MKALLVLLAAGKFGKVLLTGGSMLLSLVIYAQIWGWRYAAGFLLLLLLHEMGHVIAAWQRGVPVSAPAFIPFVGALITLREAPRDVETEAHIAYGGPFLGTLGAFTVYFWARHTDSMLGLAVAYAGFVLNLFNLLPVSPLDGGRITAVLGPRIWLLGAPALLALMLYQPSPVLLLIALMAAPHVWHAWNYDPSAPENRAYYSADPRTKLEYTVLYLGLVLLLGLMTYNVHEMLTGVRAG